MLRPPQACWASSTDCPVPLPPPTPCPWEQGTPSTPAQVRACCREPGELGPFRRSPGHPVYQLHLSGPRFLLAGRHDLHTVPCAEDSAPGKLAAAMAWTP